MSALVPGKAEPFVEGARPEIHRDRADHADRIEAGEPFKIFRHGQHDDRGRDRGDERNLRNAVGIQPGELARHLAVLRHHVGHTDQRHDRRVHRAEQEQSEHDPDNDAERLAHREAARHSAVDLREKAQHVFFVRGELRHHVLRQREHRPAEQARCRERPRWRPARSLSSRSG